MSVFQFSRWFVGLMVAIALAACGGGGGGGDPLLGSTPTPTAAKLQIRFSPLSVDNTGTQNVTATITALDANGRTLSGVPLNLSVDKNATFTVLGNNGSMTAADGSLVTNVTIGNDYSLRTITMTAASGGISTASSFDVVGSRQAASDLTLTAASQVENSFTNTVTVTAVAVDANRNALSNIPITFSVVDASEANLASESISGATISPAGTATGANGALTAVLRIGSDQSTRDITVRATSGSVVRETKVRVVGARLTATQFTPAVGTGTSSKVTYVLLDNTGVRMSDYPINITTSAGGAAAGRTDSKGEYTYNFVAPSTAQTLTVRAAAAGEVTTQQISVAGTVVVPVATDTVSSASLAASPQSVAVNTAGSTANNVEVRALFLAANNRPVKNIRVWFDLAGDKQSIGGTFASNADRAFIYSDANGVARTTYAPGTRFSPKDGVTLRACWDYKDFAIPGEGGTCPNETKTTLTVTSESLSVSIGTNGTVEIGPSGLTYIKRFVVQVVDSSGQAKSGVTVSPSIDLLSFYKGEWRIVGDRWVQGGFGTSHPIAYGSGAPVGVVCSGSSCNTASAGWTAGNVGQCHNEDLNRNGVAETFFDTYELALIDEDQNGSGSLTPVRPRLDPRKADVTITVVSGQQTDASGIVTLKIEYPQNLGSWVGYNVLVSASGVAGTEGRANFEGVLPVLASAVSTITADPAFRFSPYGQQSSPAFYRRNAEGQAGWLCTNPL